MSETDQDLRERFRSGLRPSDGNVCPAPGELWDAAAGALSFKSLRAVVDHAAGCAQCSEALRIARDVRVEAPADLATPTGRSLRPHFPVLVGLGLAAGLGAFLVLRPATPGPDAVERGAPGGSPASTLRSLSPDHQGRGAVVLRWTPYPGARSYNVTVLTPDLAVVHQAVGVSEQELRLPPGAVGADAAAHELLWNVDAVLPDGRTVGSPTFRVEVQ